jgi:nucleotide sugar dehydrogenase
VADDITMRCLDGAEDRPELTVGIVGMGYVGLPTALAFGEHGHRIVGFDIDEQRLRAIRDGEVDLLPRDLERLGALDSAVLTTDPARLRDCDAVIICVPTPVDDHLVPHLGPLVSACATVVREARAGQTVILTSTSYAGTTNDLLVRPLAARGFIPGRDIFVAFSPERIDPANAEVDHTTVPRVLGGATDACTARARAVLEQATPELHVLSSAEAAELCKLLENTFRAVNISLANEFAGVARALDVDPLEIIAGAATKPFGFMPFYPGPGVGGHCIPCDPHYLRWQMRACRVPMPVVDAAMEAIAHRPRQIVDRVVETVSARGAGGDQALVLVVGVAYKPNVADVREAPALEIIEELRRRGMAVDFFDPLVPELTMPDGTTLQSQLVLEPAAYDVVLVLTAHDRVDPEALRKAPVVIDATYRLDQLDHRILP